MSTSSFESPTLGIGKLLYEGSRYLVPHHQRDYSWTEDEIEQLFTDLEEARLTEQQEEYFIGLMVFMPHREQEYIILDGQQRLATTIIILSSIRTWLSARGLKADAEKIQGDFIALREYGEESFEPRLQLNNNNHRVFEECVIQETPTEEIERRLSKLKRYDPNRLLLEAVILCRKHVNEMTSAHDREASSRLLFDLVKYLRDNVKIVRLTVPSEANAYTVFETLNDRGLDLSILDLVKNYLFGKAGNRLSEVQSQWTSMMSNLLTVEADDFLKVWWTSRYGRVQKPQLFPKFKAKIHTASNVRATASDMFEASEQYAAIDIADDPLWAGYSKESKERIRALRLIGARQVHPILLSALAKFAHRELERLLHLLEVLIVRYQLIGGNRTGRLEISCAGLAVAIFQEKVQTATQAHEHLKEIIPSDDEFEDAFKTKQEKTNRKAHYILARLEEAERQASGLFSHSKELSPSDSLTVEHILPKKPDSDWSMILEQDKLLVEECVSRLGNMCLLGSANKKLGNSSFDKKKHIYKGSELLLTQKCASEEVWTRKEIEARQNFLASLAVRAWRFQ